MIYRSEIKHEITPADKFAIISSLRAVARPDPHAGPDGRYRIRSLYFDDWRDRALREKLDGVSEREKFRLRLYESGDVHLEKKVKRGGAGCLIANAEGQIAVPAYRTNCVDTTGAGDAFCAGVSAGLTYGRTLAQAVEIGTRLAASVITSSENVCPRFRPEEFGISL